jgi:hypothetical protein
VQDCRRPVVSKAAATGCVRQRDFFVGLEIIGGPERSRTSDLRFRKPLLYPAELRDRTHIADLFENAFEMMLRFCSTIGRTEGQK